jgi:hypothetical protein
MAAFFRQKSLMEKLETELASLRAREETLGARHTVADAAFLDAKSKLQRHHLKADLDADDKARAKLEAAVAACAVTRDGYADALGEVQAQIADTEQGIAAERAAVERKAASEKLARDLDAVECSLPKYLEASRRFVAALEALHHHFEATEMARFVANGTAQVEIAAGFTLAELRAMVDAIRDGAAPIPAPKPELEPVTVIEPAPPQTTVFMIKTAKYLGDDGKTRHCGQYEDCSMPPAVAQKALRCGAAVPITDERRRHLPGVRRGDFQFDAPDVVDLDDEEATRPPHIAPVMASDPLASADFRVIDCGPARTIPIAVPRL